MGFTRAELNDFHHFADTELSRGDGDLTLEECLRRWRSSDEDREAAIADIREGIADEQAGRVRSLAEVADQMRHERDFSR